MTTRWKEATPVKKTRTALAALGLAALLTLTACGGDDADGGTDTATDSPTAGAPSGPPGGFDTAQLEEIQACLEAAGLEDKMPTGMPTDMPTDVPSDFPTDMPTDMPSDFGSGGPGGGLGALQDPEVQEALEACGIELPQAPGQG